MMKAKTRRLRKGHRPPPTSPPPNTYPTTPTQLKRTSMLNECNFSSPNWKLFGLGKYLCFQKSYNNLAIINDRYLDTEKDLNSKFGQT